MTDERRDTTPPEVERSREAGETETEVDRLRAEVDRLTHERDAILRWSIKHAGYIGSREHPPKWWARGDGGRVIAYTAEEAVRKAAGLDTEGSNT